MYLPLATSCGWRFAHSRAPCWQRETAWRREPLYAGFPPGSNRGEFQSSINATRFVDCLAVKVRLIISYERRRE
jgi:transposase